MPDEKPPPLRLDPAAGAQRAPRPPAEPTRITQLPVRRGSRLRRAVERELRSRPFGYIVFATFVVAGPFVVPLIFPDASPLVGLVGGVCFGAYAALCAVPQKFL